MPASIIRSDASLASVLDEGVYTQAKLAANDLTKSLAADFDTILTSWTATNGQEIQLRIAMVKAQALVSAADDVIDLLADAVSQAVLLDVKNDRKAPQYVLYFGTKSPSDLKRPVLGGQLETMRAWIPSLKASANPVLKDLGTKLEAAVATADAAVKGLAVAEQQNRDFRVIGGRQTFIDSFNALRKSTYGKLSEMPHSVTSEHLPAGFAEEFFRHDTKKPTKLGTKELTEAIAAAESELANLKEQLTKSQAEDSAAEKAKSEAEAHAAQVAQAEKEAEAALAKVAALKAQKK